MIVAPTNTSSPTSCTLSPSQRPRSKRSSALYAPSPNLASGKSLPASPRPSSSTRSSGNLSAPATVTSPQVHPPTATDSPLLQPRSPKRPTRDFGTQYSPTGPPPTSRPSSSRDSSHSQALPRRLNPGQQQQPAGSSRSAVAANDGPQASTLAVQGPPEPKLRLTPQPSSEGASSTVGTGSGTAGRRTHSSISTPSSDAPTASTSPTKRVRKPNPDAVVMPRVYAQCDPKELAVVISDMLLELIRVNDEIPLQDGQLTRFHSRAPPGISVRDYLHRLTYHATLPPPILLAMVTYVDKLCAMFPAFRINSLTVHRFLITAATVASKGLSDSFWTNSTYSKVGGVTIKELALLELELLERVEWRIVPKPEVLEEYYVSLVERSENHVLQGALDAS